jgi:3-dehydroquinate synthase
MVSPSAQPGTIRGGRNTQQLCYIFRASMDQINVNTPSGHYAVICRRGVLERVGATVSGLVDSTGVFILSSARVWKHWGKRLEGGFREYGGAKVILMDDREQAKTLRTVEKLCRSLARARADRACILIAFGGGVVGDMAGFVAASYLRGVRVVQVPTTLVAQIDSGIGGKTGVNLAEGKNLVGAFHQPRLVVVDPEVLQTMSLPEYRAGLYEVIKCGVISDAKLFELLEQKLPELLEREAEVVDEVLPRCIQVKSDVVSHDEREAGLRQVLNFGHTVGHALETATRYQRFRHGEAVGWGMLVATHLAQEMKLLDADDAGRIAHLILRVGPLPSLPNIKPQRLLEIMRGDKKARAGKLAFVLPLRIGEVEVHNDVPEEVVLNVLQGLRNFATK